MFSVYVSSLSCIAYKLYDTTMSLERRITHTGMSGNIWPIRLALIDWPSVVDPAQPVQRALLTVTLDDSDMKIVSL